MRGAETYRGARRNASRREWGPRHYYSKHSNQIRPPRMALQNFDPNTIIAAFAYLRRRWGMGTR